MDSVGRDWKGVGMFGWKAAGMDRTEDRYIASAAELDLLVAHSSMSVRRGPESSGPRTGTREAWEVGEDKTRRSLPRWTAMLQNGGRGSLPSTRRLTRGLP
jgi:hypothetical protein